METRNIFYLDSTPTIPGKYIIRVKHDEFYCKSTLGSYGLLECRLFNISPANYLRLCRDEYGAEIYGKNAYYPVAYFNNDARAKALVETLNKLATMVLWEREHKEVIDWAKENK